MKARMIDMYAENWHPIDTAPKGSVGTTKRDHEDYISPPRILLLFKTGDISVGYWDWYYAEGGRGYEGGLAWIEPVSGERLDLHYDPPISWVQITQPNDES